MKLRLFSWLALAMLAWGAQGQTLPATNALPATNTTAFALARAGDKYVSPKAKDKFVEMHSEKSTGGLVPDVWYVEYFDPAASMRRTEVKFVAGKMTEVTQPKHYLDVFSGTKQMTWRRLKIDSDRALAIALKEPMLKKVHLQAAQYWLDWGTTGSIWKLQFWAARRGKPEQTTSIGELYLSCTTGEIVKNSLSLKNAD